MSRKKKDPYGGLDPLITKNIEYAKKHLVLCCTYRDNQPVFCQNRCVNSEFLFNSDLYGRSFQSDFYRY